MRKFCMILIFAGLIFASGCGNQQARMDPVPDPPVEEPRPSPEMEDTPPQEHREDPYVETSVKPDFRPAVSDEDKSSLMHEARLDLLRIMLCADENFTLGGDSFSSDFGLQAAKEHFSAIGFRVVEGPGCPRFEATGQELMNAARQRDVDMFVLMTGEASKVDSFGNFHSYQARGRGKAAQITDTEIITTQSTSVRGKRALDEQEAAESALQASGRELALKISDEILRKSARGLLLRRIEVDGIARSADSDYIRVSLAGKPGIRSVNLISWDETTRRAVFWVRLDAAAKENLAAYLENLERVRLRVERLDTTDVDTRQRGLFE